MRPKNIPGNHLEHFRSIVVMGNLQSVIATGSYAVELGNWMRRFHAFQRKAFGWDRGENQYLAVSRTIAFMGDAVLSAKSEQLHLCELGRELGFATAVRIPVEEALSNSEAFLELIARESPVSTVILDARKQTQIESPDDVCRLSQETVRTGKTLALMGAVLYWIDSGILDSPEINGTLFNMYGVPEHDVTSDNEVLASPCASRFQVFISKTGEIYPCRGLVDVQVGRIGHISSQPEQDFLSADGIRLDELARHGHEISRKLASSPLKALPPICRIHREELSIEGAKL